MDIYNDYVYTE